MYGYTRGIQDLSFTGLEMLNMYDLLFYYMYGTVLRCVRRTVRSIVIGLTRTFTLADACMYSCVFCLNRSTACESIAFN